MSITRNIRTRFIGEDRTGPAARSARRNVAGIGASYETLNRRVATTNRLISTATLGVGGASALRTAADMQSATSRLAAVSRNLASDQEFLSRTSRGMSIDLEAAYTTMAKLTVLESSGALQQGDARKYVIGLSDAFARFGANAGQQENVIYGLAQALGQGTVQAAELNQVVEPLPGLLSDIAKQSGKTAGEYRQLIKEGNTLSEVFSEGALATLSTYAGSAERLSGNIRQTLTRLATSYKELVQEFNAPLSVGIQALADTVGGGLDIMSANAEQTGLVLQGLLLTTTAVFGGRALTAVGDYTKKYVVAAAARNSAIATEVRASRASQQTRARAAAAVRTEAADAVAISRLKTRDALLSIQTTRAVALAEAQARANKKAGRVDERRAAVEQATLARASAEASRAKIAAEREVLIQQRTLAAEQAKSAGTDRQKAAATTELAAARKRAVASASQLRSATVALNAAERQVVGTGKKLATARNAQAVAQAKVVAQQAQITASIASEQAASARAVAAVNVHTTARSRLRIAVLAESAALARNTIILRVQQGASIAAAGAARALSGAMALVGGPAGAAILAAGALYTWTQRTNESSGAVEALTAHVQALEQAQLNSRAAISGTDPAVQGANERIDALRKEIAARKELRAIEDGVDGSATLQSISPGHLLWVTAKRAYQDYFHDLDGELAELEKGVSKSAGVIEDQYLNAWERARRATHAFVDHAKVSALELADSLNKPDEKISTLRANIEQLSQATLSINVDDGELARINTALSKARSELAQADGSAAAAAKLKRDRAREVTSAINAQNQALEGSLTQQQQITAEYTKQIAAIERAQSIVPSGTEGLASQQEAGAAIRALKQQQQAEITELEADAVAERIRRRIDAEREAIREEMRLRAMLLAADNITGNPVDNAVAAGVRREASIRADALAGRITRELDVGRLIAANDIQTTRDVEAAKTQIAAQQLEARKKAQKVHVVDQGASVLTRLLRSAQSEVGQYIAITERMTTAERTAAEQSNAVNERRFKKNKKLRKKAAIIDMLAGANRALAQGGFWGIANAIAVLAVGSKNLRSIQAESFASSSGGAGGGYSGGQSSAPRITPANQPAAQLGRTETVVLVAGNFHSEEEAMLVAGNQLRELSDRGLIYTNGEPMQFDNLPAPVRV